MGVACSCSSAPGIVRYDAPALRPAVPSSWYLFAHVLFPLRENVRVGSIKYQTLLINICSCEFTSPCAYSISLRVGIEKKTLFHALRIPKAVLLNPLLFFLLQDQTYCSCEPSNYKLMTPISR